MVETILVTGASGFLGRRIARFLQRTSDAYLLTTSRQQESFPNHLVRELSEAQSELTDKVDTVIHFAGLNADSKATELEFYQSNVENTIVLAKAAIASGVKRFIYISTVDVYGSQSKSNEILTEQSALQPQTAYAKSKLSAENVLKELCADGEINLIILRLALIYHIDAVNEFGQYIHMVKQERPLPLANISNQRTLLALRNFESGLDAVLRHPEIKNQTFNLADSHALSTPEIMNGIAVAAIVPIKLFYAPKIIAQATLKLTGRKQLFKTFWGDFQISSQHAQTLLQWVPNDNYVVNLSK